MVIAHQQLNEMTILIRGMEALRREFQSQDLQMQTALLFLQVGQHGEVSMSDLEKQVGISQASVSRGVGVLSTGRPDEPGRGILEAFEDPYYRRRKIVKLTPRGKSMFNRIIEAMRKGFA